MTSYNHRPLPRTAVIGAGSSGIAAVKALVEAGVPTVCFEKGERVGGNWVFRNSNGMSASYSTLHINTSRERMEYSDFPMPKSYPDFPHHSHIAAYFDDYVDHFGFRGVIRFGVGVESAVPREGGGWTLTLDTGEVEEFDALVVANGHHWNPRWPDPAPPGADTFTGVQMHAHSFEENSIFEGKRVLVVGMGNSAMDIAVESSWVAADTVLSARTPVHVVPKYVFGRPLDTLQEGWVARLPWKWRQWATELILKIAVGDYRTYGLAKPEHGVFQAHPTISDAILSRMAHGEVRYAPDIARIDGATVRFKDGSSSDFDTIVWCTGYKITFPFFTDDILAAKENQISLFQRVFPVDRPDLAVIGLVQPLGAIMPLAEEQGRLVAAYLSGNYVLPSRVEREKSMAGDAAEVAARYIGSKRHTIQVDFDSYLHRLKVELRKGRDRAVATSHTLPVPVRETTPA